MIPLTMRSVRLGVEQLEPRELPSAALSVDTFENDVPKALATGWTQWSNETSPSFQVVNGVGLGGGNGLVSNGDSGMAARTWLISTYAKDVQIQADVLLNSIAPVQLLARGANLGTTTPTYYAVSITRGMEVDLLSVNDGKTTVLATVVSNSWLSDKWVRVNFAVQGSQLTVQVFRVDTAQYLGPDDAWHDAPVQAISLTNHVVTNAGRVGLARVAGSPRQIVIDNFGVNSIPAASVPAALVDQDFNTNLVSGLPADWASYTNIGNQNFQVAASTLALTDSSSVSVTGSTGLVARAWSNSVLPADVQVSASLYLNNLVPAQVFARGQNLGTDSPDYYAVSLTRGATAQLIRVVNGATNVLGAVTSDAWLGPQWVQATLSVIGTTLGVQVYRTDSGQYLTSSGLWQVAPTWAIQLTDTAILGPGQAGIGRGSGYSGATVFDNFVITTVPANGSSGTGSTLLNNFNSTPIGSLPTGWSSWTKDGRGAFQVAAPSPPSTANGFASNGASDVAARAWFATQTFSNLQLSGSAYMDALVPAQLLVRGQNLNSTAPSYYAVSVTRGLSIQILRVVNGNSTVLASMSSRTYLSNLWLTIGLQAEADTLEVVVSRQDTGQYLAANGTWQSGQSVALAATDGALPSGYIGVNRPASYTGRALFSNLSVVNLSDSAPPPPPPPPTQGGLSNPGTPPPTPSPGGTVTPAGIQHYPYIRVAELAYYGTPIGDNELNLLKNSIDLVVSNPVYLAQIDSVAPLTPQVIYTNVSNIYLNLLTDWLSYANKNGIDPESAFYHVITPTPFSGSSSSSRPVDRFWSIQVGSNASGWSDFTSNATENAHNFSLGSVGQSMVVGYVEPFNHINLTLTNRASAGWSGELEYATAVDANGAPTAWTTLNTVADTTRSFASNGQITFDPPANWKMATINGGGPLYYVRVRTISNGIPPTINTILADDYVHANGGITGLVPVFDYAADTNHDGYLNAAEYAVAVKAGDNARFAYQSRLFYPSYGQMRFATNVSNAAFQQWAVDYSYRYLNANPLADGLFVDNSISQLDVKPGTVKEALTAYSSDYGALLAAVNKKIAPRLVLANTAGAGMAANSLVADGVSYFEEFALRPLVSNTSQFEDMAAQVQSRLTLASGKGIAILDAYPQGGAPADSRTQIAEMAEYYLVADPKQTFIDFNGGYAPATAWSQHWTNAVNYNVGQPVGSWSTFASGLDPSNHALTYKIYERHYQNALVLYKPLSYANWKSGTLADGTSTTHSLGGTYRPLNANGTLGASMTSITLRNGEGAILVRA